MAGEKTAAAGGEGGDRKAFFEDVEGTARRMGWKPEDQFKGDKSKWRPPEEYVETAMQNYPVLLDRYRTLDTRAAKTERQLSEATTKLDEIGSAVIEMRDFHAQSISGAEKRAYAQAIEDLKAEIHQATKDADPEAAAAALKKLDTLIETKPVDKPAKKAPAAAAADGADGADGAAADAGISGKAPPGKPKIAPEVLEWVKDNPWYNTKPKLNALAVATHNELRESHPHLSLAENLEMVSEEVKRRFAEEFDDDGGAGEDPPARRENPRRREAASVNEPGDAQPRRQQQQRGRTYADLPPEAKAACDRFTKQMIKGKDGKPAPMMTREQYLQSYPWEA